MTRCLCQPDEDDNTCLTLSHLPLGMTGYTTAATGMARVGMPPVFK